MHTSRALSFLGPFLSSASAAAMKNMKGMASAATVTVFSTRYAGYTAHAQDRCIENDDNHIFRVANNLQSNNNTNCYNFPPDSTNLGINWGDFEWVTIYRHNNCWSDDHITIMKADENLVDGQSCFNIKFTATKYETAEAETAQAALVAELTRFVFMSEGSIFFGTGDAPSNTASTLQFEEPESRNNLRKR